MRTAPLPAGALVVLVIAIAPVTTAVPTAGGAFDESAEARLLDLARVIDSASARPTIPFEAFDAFHPVLTDVDGDGRAEYVSMNDNGRAFVVDAARGRVLAEIVTRHAGDREDWHAQQLAGVAVADVTGNGARDLVVTNAGGYVTVLERDPSSSTRDAWVFDEAWEAFVSAPEHDPDFWRDHPWLDPAAYDPASRDFLVHGPAFVADPAPEAPGAWVFVSSDDYPGHLAFDATGDLAWVTSWWDGHAGPWVADLEGDNALDAVFATDNGNVIAYDARSGTLRWRFDAREHGVAPGSVSVPPTLADLDGDGAREVFFGARVAVEDPKDPDWMRKQHARYFLLDANGTHRWNASFPWGHPLVHMTPVPFDVNRDGHLDLVVLDWNTIGHKPGDWERLGPANLFAVDGRDGSILWRTPIDAHFTRVNVPVADYAPRTPGLEALVEDVERGRTGLAVVSLVDGSHVAWTPLPRPLGSGVVTRGPVTGDVDGDGRLEVVVPVHQDWPRGPCAPKRDVPCRQGMLVVFDTAAPARSLWFSGGPPNDAAHEVFPDVERAREVSAATEEALARTGTVPLTASEPAPDAGERRARGGSVPAARAAPGDAFSGDRADAPSVETGVPEEARGVPGPSALVALGLALALSRRRAPCTTRTRRRRGSPPRGTTSRT